MSWIALYFLMGLAIVVLLLVGLSSSGSAFGAFPRDLWYRWTARRWSQPGAAPETVSRSYWTEADYRRDRPRLEALGYRVENERANDPYVVPRVYLGGASRPVRQRFRVPIIHATYVLKDSARIGRIL